MIKRIRLIHLFDATFSVISLRQLTNDTLWVVSLLGSNSLKICVKSSMWFSRWVEIIGELPVGRFHPFIRSMWTQQWQTKTCWTSCGKRRPFRQGNGSSVPFSFFFLLSSGRSYLEDIISVTTAIISTCFTSGQTVVHVAWGVVSVHSSKYCTCWRSR